MKDKDNQKNPISGRFWFTRLPEITIVSLSFASIVDNSPTLGLCITVFGGIWIALIREKARTYQKNGGEKQE